MSRTIAIAGMGWLGVPLARKLKNLGFQIKGSVTQSQKVRALQNSGFNMYSVTVSEHGVYGQAQEFLEDITDLVVMIPPGLRRNTGSDYVLKMTHLLTEIEKSGAPNCIFVSSTSVYGDGQGEVTEKDKPIPENEAGRQLFQVEQLFFASNFPVSIVRFGGLYGGSRQPVRYLAGRSNLSNGNAPVNLIHRDDCIQIIVAIIMQQAYGHIFNAVNPNHPSKSDYYTRKSEEMGLLAPHYGSGSDRADFKQVNSVNLESVLDYQFTQSL